MIGGCTFIVRWLTALARQRLRLCRTEQGDEAQGHLPTVIVRHARENPRKCSILPLRGRPDVVILGYPVKQIPDLAGYVRLAAEGPEFTHVDATCGLLLLDGSWRWAASMTQAFEHVPPRSLHGYKTAYPRISNWVPTRPTAWRRSKRFISLTVSSADRPRGCSITIGGERSSCGSTTGVVFLLDKNG